jgi:hypothetical protein
VTRPRQSIETAVFQCDATYVLGNGSITAATVGSLSSGKLVLAITGGTGPTSSRAARSSPRTARTA